MTGWEEAPEKDRMEGTLIPSGILGDSYKWTPARMGSITHDGTNYNFSHIILSITITTKFLKVNYNYIMSESITMTLEVQIVYEWVMMCYIQGYILGLYIREEAIWPVIIV